MARARWVAWGFRAAAAFLVAGIAALSLSACKDSKKNSQHSDITFHKDIAPILWKNCSTCHRPGEAGPFTLITYDDAKKHAREIVKVTRSRFMPPWLPEPGFGEFADERRLTDAEIDLISKWVEAACPEGKPAAPPPQWKQGWQLGQPDLVAQMPEAFLMPATEKDVYRNFVIPISLPASKWIKSFELRVG